MKLFIMRHGEAATGTPDAKRPLDLTGQQEVASMAAWFESYLSQDECRALRVVSSPYDRAQQTARIIAQQLHVDEIMALPLITPDAPVDAVIEWLAEHIDETPWLVVSHMPLVGDLVGRLVDGGMQARLPLGTADVVALEADVWAAGCSTLKQHVTPATAAAI
ncbi:phosphohistidine phosphatase SixA [Phytohalomonas tamaricis]|uniref:phosphohistidine phosphatase SixA n=1 Tax=Phytohalomonas tamaricis TaxID=2081032 RepID=UPI000D0B48A7|nr:phosphohistidine phosphatase SixA [Phytohalomonas tamaricis]